MDIAKKDYKVLKTSCYEKTCSVSVIIPVYNVEEYLAECLDSIVNQTFQDLEIVCVNDGSSDQSLSILLSYAKNDERIAVVDQQNQGVSAARNNGFIESKGDYIYFMDSDDLLEQKAIEELYQQMLKTNCDAVYFDAVCFGDEQAVNKNRGYYQRKGDYPEVTTGSHMFALQVEYDEFRVSPCLQFLKKEHLLKNGLFYHEGVIHEDNAFALLTMITAPKVGYLHKAYFRRRYRASSIMTSKKTFKHVYGYYVAIQDVLHHKDMYAGLNIREREALHKELNTWIGHARNVFAIVSKEEQEKYKSFSLDEQLNFELLVVYPGKMKEELIKAKTRFYHKLKLYAWIKGKLSKDTIKKINKTLHR